MNVVDNAEVVTDTDHAGEGAVLADDSAATNAGTGRHTGAGAHGDVMSDMHLIIDDDVILQHRIIQGASINGSAGTDLHPVAEANTPHLDNFDPTIVFAGGKAEAIRANCGVAVYHAILTNNHIVVDHSVGIDAGALTDTGLVAKVDSGTDNRAIANDNPFLQDGIGADTDSGTQLCR